ncbi:MAG: dihydrolipoyl dehydrogenase [Acidobacteriota bacterium]|nr:dihydrolipoyl dehydrogenase [Acidobacteriota bacterium]
MVMGSLRQRTETVVIGGGPGGYVAALRAADLGREVVLVEEREAVGGVCLLEGCIPSKTLIHAVEVFHTAEDARQMGLTFSDLAIDADALRSFKQSVLDKLAQGTAGLLKSRGVEVVKGRARFDGASSLALEGSDVAGIEFQNAIVATGSRVAQIPLTKDLPVWTSREALELPTVPETLLVVGGGYIGMELGLVYAGLGSRVTLVELLPTLLTGADQDLVRVVARTAKRRFEELLTDTRVTAVERRAGRFLVTMEKDGDPKTVEVDQVLVAVGRVPNTDEIGLDKAGVSVGDDGLLPVDAQCRTNVPHILAIGDVTPGPMLAHKASRQGKVAAEAISGHPAAFDNRSVPAVVFTDPELAWTGLTEEEAKRDGRQVTVGRFPLSALGRARTMGRTDGMAKVIADPESELLLGVGLVGPHASELIAEASLAIEMGATLEDLAATIHPHPTLSEAVMEAAEVAAGSAVHISVSKSKT